MDDNTFYKLGPNVGLIPCKTKDQKFLNGTIFFFRQLGRDLSDADFKAAILMFCDFAALDGTLQTPSQYQAIIKPFSSEYGAKFKQTSSRRFQRFNDFGLLQALLTTEPPTQPTNIQDMVTTAPLSGSRCDDSLSSLDGSVHKDKTLNDSPHKKKVKKPVNTQRAQDAALVRKIFQARYQRAYGMVYSSWNGKQIGQAHAFVNQLRQIFIEVDEETVDMVVCGYFADKYSWCGDNEPGTVKTIGYMSTSSNIQDAVSLMQRLYEYSKPTTEKELKYVERLAKIRRFSEPSTDTVKPREASDEPTTGDQGV